MCISILLKVSILHFPRGLLGGKTVDAGPGFLAVHGSLHGCAQTK